MGTGGQAEINYRFDTMVHAADEILMFKYIVKNIAHAVGQGRRPSCRSRSSATTAPACTCHQSLWNDGKPLFYDENGYGGLSDIARWYIGGLLKHAPVAARLHQPDASTRYHRLVPGFEAPVNLVYSAGNRSACIRIPITGTNPKAKRIEFRAPDASGNPYLAFAAQLMAGLDGIKNRIEPHEPVDKDLYELPPEEHALIPQVPGSLSEVLDALEADHDFLTAGNVFTPDLIETWIDYKRENEIDPIRAASAPVRVRALLRRLSLTAHRRLTPAPGPLAGPGAVVVLAVPSLGLRGGVEAKWWPRHRDAPPPPPTAPSPVPAVSTGEGT